jgi:phospholipid transport system substrate-binding protein
MIARVVLTMSVVVCLSCPTTTKAAVKSPLETLRQIEQRIKRLLKSKGKQKNAAWQKSRLQVRDAVNTLIDFQHLAQGALSNHWLARSALEQTEFVAVFSDVVERNYVKQLQENINYSLEYRKQTVRKDRAQVLTVGRIERDGRPEEVEIEYHLRRVDSRWMAYDVVTDGVSVMRNYRSQFNRIIRKDGYSALIQKLRRRLQTLGPLTL